MRQDNGIMFNARHLQELFLTFFSSVNEMLSCFQLENNRVPLQMSGFRARLSMFISNLASRSFECLWTVVHANAP